MQPKSSTWSTTPLPFPPALSSSFLGPSDFHVNHIMHATSDSRLTHNCKVDVSSRNSSQPCFAAPQLLPALRQRLMVDLSEQVFAQHCLAMLWLACILCGLPVVCVRLAGGGLCCWNNVLIISHDLHYIVECVVLALRLLRSAWSVVWRWWRCLLTTGGQCSTIPINERLTASCNYVTSTFTSACSFTSGFVDCHLIYLYIDCIGIQVIFMNIHI